MTQRDRKLIYKEWLSSLDGNELGPLLEALLDIRDLLTDLYNRDADVKIQPGLKEELLRQQKEAGR